MNVIHTYKALARYIKKHRTVQAMVSAKYITNSGAGPREIFNKGSTGEIVWFRVPSSGRLSGFLGFIPDGSWRLIRITPRSLQDLCIPALSLFPDE